MPSARALLLAGCDPNAQNVEGNTPLHVACAFGSFDLINFLLASGAKPDVENNHGDLPMRLVFSEGQGIYLAFYEDDEFIQESNGLKIPKFKENKK